MPFEVLNDTEPLSMFLQSITGAFYSPYKTVNYITIRLPGALKWHLICGYRYISGENISIIERFLKTSKKKPCVLSFLISAKRHVLYQWKEISSRWARSIVRILGESDRPEVGAQLSFGWFPMTFAGVHSRPINAAISELRITLQPHPRPITCLHTHANTNNNNAHWDLSTHQFIKLLHEPVRYYTCNQHIT